MKNRFPIGLVFGAVMMLVQIQPLMSQEIKSPKKALSKIDALRNCAQLDDPDDNISWQAVKQFEDAADCDEALPCLFDAFNRPVDWNKSMAVKALERCHDPHGRLMNGALKMMESADLDHLKWMDDVLQGKNALPTLKLLMKNGKDAQKGAAVYVAAAMIYDKEIAITTVAGVAASLSGAARDVAIRGLCRIFQPERMDHRPIERLRPALNEAIAPDARLVEDICRLAVAELKEKDGGSNKGALNILQLLGPNVDEHLILLLMSPTASLVQNGMGAMLLGIGPSGWPTIVDALPTAPKGLKRVLLSTVRSEAGRKILETGLEHATGKQRNAGLILYGMSHPLAVVGGH